MAVESTKIQGVIGMVTMAMFVNIGLFFWISYTGAQPAFLQDALNSGVVITLTGLVPSIQDHIIARDTIGIGVSLLIQSFFYISLAYIVFVPTRYGFALFMRMQHKKANKKAQSDTADLDYYMDDVHVTVKFPYMSKDEKGNDKVDFKDVKHPFPETAMRLERANITLNREIKNPIERLEFALLQILYKHKYWTCDPKGYHGDKGLYEHSLDVSAEMVKRSKNNPLARCIGLAHDIGKLLAYEPGDIKKNEKGDIVKVGKWSYLSYTHDKASAHIVRMLPEFKVLPEETRSAINTVLAYSHSHKRLPKHAFTTDVITLIKALRLADGISAEEDKQQGIDLIDNDEMITELSEYLKRLFPRLNINEVSDGYADGWTTQILSFIAIKEQSLREKLHGVVPQAFEDKLRLRADILPHPSTPLIVEALKRIDYIIEEHEHNRPANSMFTVKVGDVKFHSVILINKTVLEQELGDMIDEWGDSRYKIKVNPGV